MPSVLSADALTTLANLKEQVGIASADTSKDNTLERFINRATQWIEGQTGRKLKARSYNGFNESAGVDFKHKTGDPAGDSVASEDFLLFFGNETYKDECGRGVYHLPQFPVLKVNSTAKNIICHPNALTFTLEVLSSRSSSGGETWNALTGNDDYILEHEKGIIRLIGSYFTNGLRNYRVKCSAGYSVGTADTQPYVPGDLEQLCIAVAKKMYRDEQGLQSESIGTWSRSWNTEKVNEFIEATIARYRRFSL